MLSIKRDMTTSLNSYFFKVIPVALFYLVHHYEYYPQNDHAKQDNLEERKRAGSKIEEK